MWHKPCRTFHPWCPCTKTRCLYVFKGKYLKKKLLQMNVERRGLNAWRLMLVNVACLAWTHYIDAWKANPDSKVHGANMGPTWDLSAPDGPHVGPLNLAIRAMFDVVWCCQPHRMDILNDDWVMESPNFGFSDHRSITPKFVMPTAPSCIDNIIYTR